MKHIILTAMLAATLATGASAGVNLFDRLHDVINSTEDLVNKGTDTVNGKLHDIVNDTKTIINCSKHALNGDNL